MSISSITIFLVTVDPRFSHKSDIILLIVSYCFVVTIAQPCGVTTAYEYQLSLLQTAIAKSTYIISENQDQPSLD